MSASVRTLLTLIGIMIIVHGAAIAAESAIGRGSLIVGGGAMYSSMGGDLYKVDELGFSTFGGASDSTESSRTTLLLFAPEVGGFVMDHLAISGQLLIGNLSFSDYKVYVIGFGPRVRYYFGNPTGTVKKATYPYLSAGLIWGELTDWDDDKHSLLSYTFGGGITHMMANSVGIYAELNYRDDGVKWAGTSERVKGNSINFFAGFTLFLWE